MENGLQMFHNCSEATLLAIMAAGVLKEIVSKYGRVGVDVGLETGSGMAYIRRYFSFRDNVAWRGNHIVFSRVLEDHRYLGAVF